MSDKINHHHNKGIITKFGMKAAVCFFKSTHTSMTQNIPPTSLRYEQIGGQPVTMSSETSIPPNNHLVQTIVS